MSYQTELLELLPWVKRLKTKSACEGIRWSRVPLKAVYGQGGREMLFKYRCTKLGHWRFTPLRRRLNYSLAGRPEAKSFVYCWQHLTHSGVSGTMEEDTRATRWWTRHIVEVNALRARHDMRPVPTQEELDEMNKTSH